MTPAPTAVPRVGLLLDVAAACDRIAPTWPLDRFIAVNPYWGWRSSPIGEAAARLGALAGTPLTMPRAWFREERRTGRLSSLHLEEAAAIVGNPDLADAARSMLDAADEPSPRPLQRMALVADLSDEGRWPVPGQSWTDLMVHQISQQCASYVDEWQASWTLDRASGLFASWRTDPSVTRGVSWRRGRAWARARLDALAEHPTDALATMLGDLGVGPDGREAYLTALLASVNGWAAWFAYQRWQARLADTDDETIVDLLAIRLAWDWLLAGDVDDTGPERDRLGAWAASWALVDDLASETAEEQQLDWMLQTAVELAFQDPIISGLPGASAPSSPAEVQAVFCIDVRSEVLRRALESTASGVHTRGFAGFFGLPITYTPAGSTLTRPQLPGLLAPALGVTDMSGAHTADTVAAARSRALRHRHRWQTFRSEPSSMFSYVESLGLLSGVKLIKESLPHRHAPDPWERDGLGPEHAGLRPRLALVDDDPAAAAAIGHRVLTAMGLVEGFAPVVMLCGHGSHSANNPQAARLDCGACGGHTGEVNARALADLLNTATVRQELASLGVHVPDGTWFVAALHDTASDDVELFDTELAPLSHQGRIGQLAAVLATASGVARAERAGALGLGALTGDPARLERRVQERANDWSQVRPEWGLAGNAALVVAPRWRTRHLDLGGRCFLHDYAWRLDPELSVLTLIMTAPMVVTNWINLQYYASTVDNRRYGSGDKMLHNVVGGHVGVFEGNGGDLRIGLPMQSLHDGRTLRHRPLRLSVFVEAPRASIDQVIAEQSVVQQLVHGHWLHLLRIESTDGSVERRSLTGWEPHPSANPRPA